MHSGWELSDEQCDAKAQEAREFLQTRQNQQCRTHTDTSPVRTHLSGEQKFDHNDNTCTDSMDPTWGFPDESFGEVTLQQASRTKDWQSLTMLPIAGEYEDAATLLAYLSTAQPHTDASNHTYAWRRNVAMWVLASLRFHEWRVMSNVWCAFEAYSRWSMERQHIPLVGMNLYHVYECYMYMNDIKHTYTFIYITFIIHSYTYLCVCVCVYIYIYIYECNKHVSSHLISCMQVI
jgi:hypothetical protein